MSRFYFFLDIFRCCQIHDECYDQVGQFCWPKIVIYFRYGCTGCSKYFRFSTFCTDYTVAHFVFKPKDLNAIYIYIRIRFLSRTYFVERSTQLIEEHQL